MNLKLYESNELLFNTNGIGVLSDAISCTVTEELNGAFELRMEYPVNGIFADQIVLRRIVFAKPNSFDREQPFRIYGIEKRLNTLVVRAEHISYDLNGYAVQMEQPTDIYEYAEFVRTKCANTSFQFSIEVLGNNTGYGFYEHLRPATARSLIMDLSNLPSVNNWSVDILFDRFDVKILTEGRGADIGAKILYGVNLLDYSQEDLFQDVYTHIMPYWVEDIGTGQEFLVTRYLPEKIMSTGVEYDFQRILPVDLTNEVSKSDEITDDTLRFAAQTYIEDTNLGIPNPQITVEVASLHNAFGENNVFKERIQLGDTVHLEIPQYNLDIPRRCVKTEYDCLKDRYSILEFGNTRTGIEFDIYRLGKQAEETYLGIGYERLYNKNNYARKT